MSRAHGTLLGPSSLRFQMSTKWPPGRSARANSLSVCRVANQWKAARRVRGRSKCSKDLVRRRGRRGNRPRRVGAAQAHRPRPHLSATED